MEFDMDIREKEEVNMKTEKVIGSREEKCIDVKDQEDFNNEEEEENIVIKEEVRMRIQCNILWNKGWNRLVDLYVCMSVIRHISTVFRNVGYLWLMDMYSLC